MTTTKKRTTTPHAKAAQAIRQELKQAFPEVKFKVRSRSFSMGNSVDVYWAGVLETGVKTREISEVISKYQYGHFDGMTDCYDITNSRDDLPQVKYVSLHMVRD